MLVRCQRCSRPDAGSKPEHVTVRLPVPICVVPPPFIVCQPGYIRMKRGQASCKARPGTRRGDAARARAQACSS